jgi:hypothetical protein
MSLRWSEEQLQEYQSKRHLPQPVGYVPLLYHKERPDEGPESSLQSKIEKWCIDHHFYFIRDRSRGRNTPGQPDLVIALPDRRTLWIELKSKMGRLRPEQIRVIQQLILHGHEIHVVKSFRQFLTIVHEDKTL